MIRRRFNPMHLRLRTLALFSLLPLLFALSSQARRWITIMTFAIFLVGIIIKFAADIYWLHGSSQKDPL